MSAPTAAQVRPALQTALQAALPFTTHTILALFDNNTKEDRVDFEAQLEDKGLVLAISPLMSSRFGGMAARRTKETAIWMVEVRQNPTVCARPNKPQLDHDNCVDAVIKTITSIGDEINGTLPGLQVGTASDPGDNNSLVRQQIQNDAGLLTTAVYCNLTLTLPKP